jgi:alkanesulfonate monooxygenase SsuD/methylene tetrahydromethanopterin reductase-like flavin-dependent oxidoreductase (luciferase family)
MLLSLILILTWNIRKEYFLWKEVLVLLTRYSNMALLEKPDNIAEKLREYRNAGVDQFFLAFQDPFDHKALDLFMEAAVTI